MSCRIRVVLLLVVFVGCSALFDQGDDLELVGVAYLTSFHAWVDDSSCVYCQVKESHWYDASEDTDMLFSGGASYTYDTIRTLLVDIAKRSVTKRSPDLTDSLTPLYPVNISIPSPGSSYVARWSSESGGSGPLTGWVGHIETVKNKHTVFEIQLSYDIDSCAFVWYD